MNSYKNDMNVTRLLVGACPVCKSQLCYTLVLPMVVKETIHLPIAQQQKGQRESFILADKNDREIRFTLRDGAK